MSWETFRFIIGDYVSSTIPLTTVDENRDFEAYIYIPSERAAQVKRGLPVDILDNSGKLIERAHIDFVSPQVDNGLQGILAKASLRSGCRSGAQRPARKGQRDLEYGCYPDRSRCSPSRASVARLLSTSCNMSKAKQ